MKKTKFLMGMHATIEVKDKGITKKDIQDIFEYLTLIDNTFSTYKDSSEISKLNNGILSEGECSEDMKTILKLSKKTEKETDGYFNILREGKLDPSGIVKGWAIWNSAKKLRKKGFENFYVDIGGDVQVQGKPTNRELWKIGIQNPFHSQEIVKIVYLKNKGIATSGTSQRGKHIYNPHQKNDKLDDVISISVVGKNVCDADRFATAAFAMQKKGIEFIERLHGFEAYMIDRNGMATYTSGFEALTQDHID